MKRSRRLAWTIAIGGALSAGCGERPEVDFQVRDPAEVSVALETPDGHRVLLPAGRESREETVPHTTPPYLGQVLYQASAIRETSGAITMRCDACLQVPLARVLPADGHGHYVVRRDREDAPRDIQWTEGEVRVGYGYEYYVSTGRYTQGPYDAFRYQLAIPRTDLLSIREHREDVRISGVVTLLIGVPLTVLATYLIVDGVHHSHDGDAVSSGSGGFVESFLGGALAVPALAFDVFGTAFVFGPAGYDRSLVPASAR